MTTADYLLAACLLLLAVDVLRGRRPRRRRGLSRRAALVLTQQVEDLEARIDGIERVLADRPGDDTGDDGPAVDWSVPRE